MADDTQLSIDLDPKKVLSALEDMSKEVKELANKIDQSLGKEAPKSIAKFEDAAEKGTNKVAAFFRNLGQRMKEDLKTAFDIGKFASGLKIGSEFAKGAEQVFDMERAFSRLNTRLQLTGKSLQSFKSELGKKVAATGQKLEDVLPGVESASARGGIKNPAQLAQIAGALGQAKATTGESTEAISETVIDILKNQGQKVTADSFKKTLDALQGTRVAGSFRTAAEAGGAINELSPYAKKLGLGTRELGGLAAQASKSGPAGQDILRQLLEKGTTIGGQEQLNAALGQKVFKNGKLDSSALGKIDQNKFGKYSQQVMQETTGLSGANGADLSRFIDSFKGGMQDLNKVVSGSDETASQFDEATNNLASKVDKFKEKAKEAGREIIGSVSNMAGDLISGKFGKLGEDAKGVGSSLYDNKGTAAAALGLGGIGAILAGSGAKGLLSKLPGGGLLSSAAGGAVAEATGAQRVYVVNASEIGGGIGGAGGSSALGAMGGIVGKGAAVGGAFVVGKAIGDAILQIPGVSKGLGGATDYAYEKLNGSTQDQFQSAQSDQYAKSAAGFNSRNGTNLSAEEYAKAVETGTLKAMVAAQKNKPTEYINKSAVQGTGKGM